MNHLPWKGQTITRVKYASLDFEWEFIHGYKLTSEELEKYLLGKYIYDI